jgi:uncharacterized protein YjbI with pentapeptide repeats
MQFILIIVPVIIMWIVLSWIDRHSPRGKQLLFYFYLILALLFLLRGIVLSAAIFGIFAAFQWVAMQRAGGFFGQTVRPEASQARSRPANLPSGCPPNCAEANLTGLNLKAVNLQGANLTGANLFVADLRKANLDGANLARVDLGGASLHGADLRRANLDGADLRGAKYDDETIWPTNFNPHQAGAVRQP